MCEMGLSRKMLRDWKLQGVLQNFASSLVLQSYRIAGELWVVEDGTFSIVPSLTFSAGP